MGRFTAISSAPTPLLRSLAGMGLAFGLAGVATPAHAEGPNFSQNPTPLQPAISGGVNAGTCAFPAVAVGPSACSATLIHPRVILCAAHCSGNINSVRFSESAQSGGRTVGVDYCAW